LPLLYFMPCRLAIAAGNRRTVPRVICQECGAEFYARSRVVANGRARARFCSRECHSLANRRRQEGTCLLCGAGFEPQPSSVRGEWGFHCCPDCLQLGVFTGEIKQCHHCGKEIYRRQADIRKSRSKLFFCDHSCRATWTNSLRAGENHPNWKKGEGAYRDIILRSSVDQVCARCGNADPRLLAVHHLDQDRTNNSLENLAWLCHNCHFLIHHYPDEMDAFLTARHTKSSAPPSDSATKLS
jgi:hypothetical protein